MIKLSAGECKSVTVCPGTGNVYLPSVILPSDDSCTTDYCCESCSSARICGPLLIPENTCFKSCT
jgi:hypothetical protein